MELALDDVLAYSECPMARDDVYRAAIYRPEE
jgi:hypothetical protein